MQKEQDPYGVYGIGIETRKALEIRMVRVRMEARRAAQSDAWGAILRIAGTDIDFELDELVALEARAEAEATEAAVVRVVIGPWTHPQTQ